MLSLYVILFCWFYYYGVVHLISLYTFVVVFVQDEDEHNRVSLIEIVSCFCRL